MSFTLKNFEDVWNALEQRKRVALIKDAAQMTPGLGILPVIKGLLSYQYNLRNAARQSLEKIQNELAKNLSNPEQRDAHRRALRQAAMVSGRLYQQIRPDMPFNDVSYFLKSLLGLGSHGAAFAFRALLRGMLTESQLKQFIFTVSETRRLVLVDQYLMATPEIRLKYVGIFKLVVSQLKEREPVIEFFVQRFDKGRDADPFLGNIPTHLTDPRTILETEMSSLAPNEKIKGLKALAMSMDRIPTRLLAGILEKEEVKKVRLVVYRIVEKSAVGRYGDLFPALVQRMKTTSDANEGLHAFKALAVTGREPLYELLGRVKQSSPELIHNIHMEVARMGRLTFFAAQDIALNRDKYEGEHFDINLACIQGLLQKRPERVARKMKKFQDGYSGQLKMDVNALVKTTQLLFQKERDGLEVPFRQVEKLLSDKTPESTGLFSALFQDSESSPLENMKISGGGINFQDQVLEGVDFTQVRLGTGPHRFNGTVFKNCKLGGQFLEGSSFTKCVFQDVDFSATVFDGANFDQAVFMNVQAPRADFRHCSFHGAKILECNFLGANFSDALMIHALIVRSIFSDANLTGCSFCHSRISAVSFVTANVNQADFSHVRASFVQYPAFASYLAQTRGMEDNARRFRLGFNDLPSVDREVVSDVNLMLFSEFIGCGEDRFLNQNKLSLLMAFDIFKSRQAVFFQVLPLLLHENIALPGQPPIHDKTPCGIEQYLPTDQVMQLLPEVTEDRNHTPGPSRAPRIEGLFTMGSVGSLAQTHESDIDYWVCVKEEAMTRQELQLLNKKLALLEAFAAQKFKLTITFFVVDVLKARNNDFGGSSQESSGSAQSRLLKEEFYRTMIHVAGKLPLWAVIPTPISLNYYNTLKGQVDGVTRSNRYMDLGDIHAIPVNEYFGASIWQMFKWLKSPFKSVIKMGLLENYIQSYGKEALLCNQYKDLWMNSGSSVTLAETDAYVILLEHLLKYYRSVNDAKSMGLLLTCFFLKLGIDKAGVAEQSVSRLRSMLLESCLDKWGWKMDRVVELGRFKEWPYERVQRLSNSIENHMLAKYHRVKTGFETNAQELMISREDRQALERKVDTMFREKPFKIRRKLLVSRSDHLFNRLHLKHDAKAGEKWVLYHKTRLKTGETEENLSQADTLEEIGGWLIHNSLYTSQSVLNLTPNPTQVTHDDIVKLYRAMLEFFSPVVYRDVPFEELRKAKPEPVAMFINVNFYHARKGTRVFDYCVIHVNSWGEMFYHTPKPGLVFSNLDAAKRAMLKGMGLLNFPSNTSFYFSRGIPS